MANTFGKSYDSLPPTAAERERVAAVVEYIKANLHTSLYSADIAAAAGTQIHSGFLELFARCQGIGLRAYIEQLRLERAKQLLADGLPLNDAARACGYAS